MTADASVSDRSASQSEDRNAGNVEVLNTMEEELEFAQMEMGFLKSLDVAQVSIQVEPGAIVVTNQRIFFIAVSSEKVEIDGEVIFVSQQTHRFIQPCGDLKKAGNLSSTASIIR